MNIKEMLEKTTREVPQKTAIALGSQGISYQELNESSNRVANALISLGMRKGDHVAILMPCTPGWLTNYFGVVKGGGKTVILNSMLKAPEYDSLLRDSDSKFLMTEKGFTQMLSSVLLTLPSLKHTIEVDSDSYAERKSFIIVTSAGVKIPPTEVEDLLLKHPCVAEAAYVGVLDEHKGQIPTLFVVPKEGQSVTKQEIRNFCRQSLANYKLPHKIEFMDSIPKTGSGKIDRRRLKESKVAHK